MSSDNGKGKPHKAINFRVLCLVFLAMAFGTLAAVSLTIMRGVQSENASLSAYVRNLGEPQDQLRQHRRRLHSGPPWETACAAEKGKASLSQSLKQTTAKAQQLLKEVGVRMPRQGRGTCPAGHGCP